MKKQISIILCLLLLFWLLPVKADAAPTGTPEQVVGEDARIVIDAPGNQTLLPGQKNVGWPMAAMVGLVCFGASVTATVIILKSKKKGGVCP